MSAPRDPAAARFLALQLIRLTGALIAGLGAAVLTHKWPALTGIPDAAAGVLIVVGAIDFFVMPIMLARKWRTPRQ